MLNVLITILLNLLYIDNHLSYKRNDLNIYKKNLMLTQLKTLMLTS